MNNKLEKMSNFSQKNNYSFFNNNNQSSYSNNLNLYSNNNINALPPNFYGFNPNFNPQNPYNGIPFNYIFQYPMINYPLIIGQNTKNNIDKINNKLEEMNNMIKNLNEEINSLKESNNELKESNNELKESNNKLQESNKILQERNDKLEEKLNGHIKNMNAENYQIKKAIINIYENMDKINANIKEIKIKLDLSGKIEYKLNNGINNILKCIQGIINEINGIKDNFNSKIEEFQNEKNKLVERLKKMENKINELQGIIIGRKIIKIIIKKILTNCFINYQIQLNTKGIYEIKNVTLKDKKYQGME